MNRQEIIKIYNSFPKEKQNVPRQKFIEQVEALTDPAKAQRDAMQIVHGRRQQRIIDAAMRDSDGRRI